MTLKILLLTGGLFTATFSLGQLSNDSIPVSINYGSTDYEFMEFLQFMNIDKYTVTIDDLKTKDKVIHIRLREFTDGKLTRTEDFLDKEGISVLYKFNASDSIFQFRVWTQEFSKDSLKIWFRFNRHSVIKKFKIHSSNNYSLRNPIIIQNGTSKIPKEKFTPFLAYSLPYEDPKRPGYLQYCTLTSDGVNPENWGKVFNVKHYILLELKFE